MKQGGFGGFGLMGQSTWFLYRLHMINRLDFIALLNVAAQHLRVSSSKTTYKGR